MNAEVLERLDSCGGDSRTLQTAIREYLSTLGITATDDYVSVLEYLYTDKCHHTADDIYLALEGRNPSLTRTKVHTILEILSKTGAVNVIQLDKYTTLYDGDTTSHGHFICSECGEVLNVAIPGNISSVVDLPAGSALSEVQILCIGQCKHCRSRNVN